MKDEESEREVKEEKEIGSEKSLERGKTGAHRLRGRKREHERERERECGKERKGASRENNKAKIKTLRIICTPNIETINARKPKKLLTKSENIR